MSPNSGTVLVGAGIVLLVLTLTASAAMAPDLEAGAGATDRTLVGGQGITNQGEVRMLNGSEPVFRITGANSYFEVEALGEGRFAVAFAEEHASACGPYEPPCARTGFRVIDPLPEPKIVSEWSFPVRTAENSELHAVEPLADGTFAVADMDRERIAVVNDGTIEWQWNASAFYEAPPDPTTTDWLHINDVDAIGGGRLLVSVRNANQLLVLERGRGVVEVINADRGEGDEATCRRPGELVDRDGDGDVRCGDPALFTHQHNPHWLGNGAVLIADSENDRVVELHRTARGRWTPVWQLSSAGGVDFYWPRDADRLPNGHTLITDSLNQRVLEVTRDGELIWSTTMAAAPYEADRLPIGETQGVPHATTNGTIRNAPGGGVPVLSTVVLALHTGLPWLPFWVRELQVALALVAAGLMIIGLLVRTLD